MLSFITGRTPAAVLASALALGALSVGCGAPSDAKADRSVQQPAALPETAPPTPAVSPSQEEQDEVSKERARREAVPGAVPVTPGSAQGSEGFGDPVAKRGDVAVFSPVRSGDEITVPVNITNTGTKRMVYRVEVRVTGAGGFDATRSMETDTVGVYPGASWPTELTFTDPGKPVPDNPRVTIVRSSTEVLG